MHPNPKKRKKKKIEMKSENGRTLSVVCTQKIKMVVLKNSKLLIHISETLTEKRIGCQRNYVMN